MAKSKPIGVRFDLDKLETIQKEQNFTSTQAVVNFLVDRYFENKVNTILMTPFGDMIASDGRNMRKKKFKLDDSFVKAMEDTKNELNALESLKNSNPEPPIGLKGIDLTIWKSENWK
jgi:hypothetical protein